MEALRLPVLLSAVDALLMKPAFPSSWEFLCSLGFPDYFPVYPSWGRWRKEG